MTPTLRHAITPILLLSLALHAPGADDTTSNVLRMTGARTRIVWAHQVKGESKRWGSGSLEFTLMGFDTAESGNRVILPGPASYGNPSITPDGSRVVYTDVSEDNTIYVVDWDGQNKKKLKPGYALCAWADPKTGIQWVYAAKAEFNSPIVRFQLDSPEIQETVWDKACGPSSGFQVSADGTRAGCVRNHPNVGTIYFNEDRHASHGWGCEAGFAPDNSYRFFHMGEWVEHAGVNMYDADGANKRAVHFGKFPDSPGYDAWNPRWSSDVRFMTVSSPNAGAEQDVYLGVFDTDVTRIEKWIRISHVYGQDLCAHAWIDPGIGTRSGEAPFTIAVPAPGGGTWRWEHGDGTTSEGPVAKHTYDAPGTYVLLGRRDKELIKGAVIVAPNANPQVIASGLRDEATLQVWFDEAVSLDSATATLKSGTQVESIRPGNTAFELALKLSARMPKRDTLALSGVHDRASARNPTEASVTVKRADWPADRTDLLLLWSGDERQRFHYDPKAGRFLETRLTRDRIARIGAHGGLILRGGTFTARGAGLGISVACKKSNAFSLEAVITPYSGTQGSPNMPRQILNCNTGKKLKQANFALCQQADALMLYCYTKPAEESAAVRIVELCTLEPNKPNHVVVTYEPGQISGYLNGKKVKGSLQLTGDLPWRNVSYQSGLSIGGQTGDATAWWGEVDRLAIYSRALENKEVVSNYKASRKAVASRSRPSQVRLRGKLTATSQIPSAAEIAPYVDALVVNEYEVLEVLFGKYRPDRVRVAQWGLISKAPQAIAGITPGTEVSMSLEPFLDHPELENDPLRDTLAEDFDMDLYLDVSMPASRTAAASKTNQLKINN